MSLRKHFNKISIGKLVEGELVQLVYCWIIY